MQLLLNLPTDILAHELYPFFTFQEIGNVDTAVSERRWRALLYEVYPFIDVWNIEGVGDVIMHRLDHLKWSRDRAIPLRKLCFSDRVTAEEIDEMFALIQSSQYMDEIDDIDVSECNLSSKRGHFNLLSRIPDLLSLNLSGCRYITEMGLCQIDSGCPQLHSLDLYGCKLSKAALSVLANRFLQVEHLHLGETGYTLTAPIATTFIQKHPNSKSLMINLNNTSDETVTFLANTCEKLTHLCFWGGGSHVNDEGLMALGENCGNLTVISCNGGNFTSKGVRDIAKGCPRLMHVRLQRFQLKDDAVASLVQNCPLIENLGLTESQQLTDVALRYIAASFKNLVDLNLANCIQLTDDGITALSLGCLKLQKLNLQGCDKLTFVVHETLFDYFSFPSLESVILPARLQFEQVLYDAMVMAYEDMESALF